MKTKVINKNEGSFDISIGRDSKWGNSFVMKNKTQAERDRVCDEFEKNFYNTDLYKSLWELKGKILGCYCKPLRCHGDFLAKQANKTFEIHSGGAEGSDSLFDKYAPENAIVVHHSFDGHKMSKGLKGNIEKHSIDEL